MLFVPHDRYVSAVCPSGSIRPAMKISVTPWTVARVLLFVLAMLGLLLAPPAVTAYTWLVLLAVPLYFWIRGSFDASLSPGDRSINRVQAVLGLFLATVLCFRYLG
jgi:hypothetical protein